jgi:hypothetical protein
MAAETPKKSLVTPLMWKAFDTTAFGYIWTNRVEWNVSKKILVYNKISWKLVPYLFAIFFCLPLYAICTFGLLLFALYGAVHLSMLSIFLAFFYVLIIIWLSVVETCFHAYGNDWATTFNGVNILEKSLQPTGSLKKKSKFMLTLYKLKL